MSKFKMLFVALLTAVALIGAGCSSDDSETAGAESDSENAPADESEIEEPDADEPDADEPETDEPETNESEADEPDADEPETDEPEVVDGQTIFDLCAGDAEALMGQGFDSFDVTNPDMEESITTLVAQFEEMADAAPDEIAEDMRFFADTFAQFDEILASIDYDFLAAATDPEAQKALLELETVFDEQRLDEASSNIEAWFEANCNVPG